MTDHQALFADFDKRGVKNIKVGVFDVDGILRGKTISRDKFESALKDGFGFCDVVLGWDSNDQLYDNVAFTGWHTAYPDANVRLLPETLRELPMEGGAPFMLAQFSGSAEAICPRGTLRRVLQRADSMGLAVTAACEFEFFLFEENPHSIREKGYRNLKNFTPGFFGYSVLRSSVHAELYQELLDLCSKMDMELEGLHTETGPGVLEAAIAHGDALAAADKAALFKTFTKVWAQRRGLMATFMAKWSEDWPGQSGHIHISLQNKQGDSVFFDGSKPGNISDTQRWFIGGQQKLLPELMSMVGNTVNSYSRMVPGMWAPLDATWGIENRTTALRVIGGSARSQRVEYRIAAADMNPYIAMAAAIGSGLWGIENRIEPSAPVEGSAYDRDYPPELRLPSTLTSAAERLLLSQPARELFGDQFVDHYAQTRIWEEREFHKAVTDWELARYFEII
jgi:glutamine synthetase